MLHPQTSAAAPVADANKTPVSTREDLLAALVSWGLRVDDGMDDETSLLQSGLLDSVALFNLLLWVEERMARPVDPAAFDLVREWDTISAILRFVNGLSAAPARPPIPAPPRSLPTKNRVADIGEPHDFEIVRYTDEFKDEIATLQMQLWSPSRDRNRAFFEWKYERNPFAGEPLIYLAVRGGKVVAMRGFCGSLWETDGAGSPFSVYCADDLVILPEYQSRGIFARFTETALCDLAARGQASFLSLSALRVTRLQSLATGSKSIGTMNPVGRAHWTFGAASKAQNLVRTVPLLWRLGQLNLLGNSAQRAFVRLDRAPAQSVGSVTISVARESRPPAMARLVRDLCHDGRIRHVRDERFFSWRFESPLHEYRFIFAEEDGGLSGYLVVQRGLSEYSNRHRVNIVDWEATTPRIGADLLVAAIRWGDFPELVMWTACLSPDKIETLERAGLVATDADQTARGLPCILVRATQDVATAADPCLGGRSQLDLANWDLRMVYTYAV